MKSIVCKAIYCIVLFLIHTVIMRFEDDFKFIEPLLNYHFKEL